MSDFISEHFGSIVTIVLVVGGAIAGYATLRYKVIQNCKAVGKIEKEIPLLITSKDHRLMCHDINSNVMKRLDKMDALREEARKGRDEQVEKITETLGYIKGRIDARWSSET